MRLLQQNVKHSIHLALRHKLYYRKIIAIAGLATLENLRKFRREKRTFRFECGSTSKEQK